MKQTIRLNESQFIGLVKKIVNESVSNLLTEADRHREGYWKERWAKQKQEKQSEATTSSPKKKSSNKKKDRHRKGYYHDYNKAHPERLNRGFTKGYKNGNVSDGIDIDNDNKIFLSPDIYIIGYDEMGRPITNNPLSDLLRNKEMEWHDDDWDEGSWDD